MTLHATEQRRLESEAREFPVGAIQSCHYPLRNIADLH
jgi:hypothetical protein